MTKLKKILLLLSLVIIFPTVSMAQGYTGTPGGTPGGDDQNYNNSGSLSGLIVQIVYIQNRYSDAMSIANILRNNGASVRFNKTSDTGNSKYTGKVLYKGGYSFAAQKISSLVRRYEYVTPQRGTPKFYKDKHFNLWITKNKGGGFVNLRNLTTNIVYTDNRYNDAMSVGDILRRKGMKVKFTKTTSGSSFRGKVLYRSGYYNHAKNIASLIRRYETVYPKAGSAGSYKNKHFNLWITSYKSGGYANLRNLITNIVYTDNRYNDAMNVGNMLKRNGMRVKYTRTTSGNSFRGKVLYKNGYYKHAKRIASLVRDYEIVYPQAGSAGSYKDKQFNLWITKNKDGGFVNLRNLITNIVYTDDRYNDAMQIAKILRNKGMIVKYTRTTTGNSYKGKILYRGGYYNHAKNIASLVKRYERVYPQAGTQNGYKDKHFNLWVTSYKGQRSTSLRGLIANIVYVDRRYNDAMDVGDILRQRGMRIKYTKTTNGNSFRGKILYRSGYFNTAQNISRIINRFERVRPQQGSSGSYKNKHFNIWITR
jgi:hypothetical protein